MKSTNVRLRELAAITPFRVLSATWPNGASQVFERLLLTPSRQRPNFIFDPHPPATRQTIPTSVGPIPTWAWGNGPTVLLVHGWNGSAVHWNKTIEPLTNAGFRAVAFDAPGHGDAPRRKTNVVEWRTAVQAVAMEQGPIHGIIGHSFGSLAALLAVQSGMDVQRAALISPPADLASLTTSIGLQLGFSEVVASTFLSRLSQRLGVQWEAIQSGRVVATLDIPVLVVHDENDREVSWRDGSVVAAAAKDGRLITTQGLGHRRIVRDPDVNRALAVFFSDGR